MYTVQCTVNIVEIHYREDQRVEYMTSSIVYNGYNQGNLYHAVSCPEIIPHAVYYYMPIILLLELKPIVVAIQWALVRTYWIDEPLE